MNTKIEREPLSQEWIDFWHRQLTKTEDPSPQDRQVLEECLNQKLHRVKVFIGAGTCGLGAGAAKTRKALEAYFAEHDISADLVAVGCIGLCSEEPLVDVQLPGRNRLCFRKVTADQVPRLLQTLFMGQLPLELVLGQLEVAGARSWENIPFLQEHPFFKKQKRLVLDHCGLLDPESIHEYLAHGGYRVFLKTIASQTPAEVCADVKKSGLRGRGGGGFLTGQKWEFALNTSADQKYMVCNADEGDPGAFMDRAVIEGDPHRVLEGLAIAAYAIGAQKAIIYIRAEYPLAIERLRKAIGDAEALGLFGDNIFDSGFSLRVRIKCGAGAFVCGEETALIRSIEGKRGMPVPRPPFPTTSGLHGKPTVINNVETLATIPVLLGLGVSFFRKFGSEKSKGTKVFALSGHIERSGLVEVEIGTTVKEVIFDIGGGIPQGRRFKAVQFGGPSGGCVPDRFLELPIDYETLQEAGAMMGSGGMVVMDERTCMVDLAKYFMQFIQRESCGKCIPCREGTKQLLSILESLTQNRASESGVDSLRRFKAVTRMEALSEVIRDTSLCGLGKSAPNPVLSTLTWFREEYEAHVFDRHCAAGTCRDLVQLRIDPDKCRGCTLCARQCPTHAISGGKREAHHIDLNACINCFHCQEICKFDAIVALA